MKILSSSYYKTVLCLYEKPFSQYGTILKVYLTQYYYVFRGNNYRYEKKKNPLSLLFEKILMNELAGKAFKHIISKNLIDCYVDDIIDCCMVQLIFMSTISSYKKHDPNTKLLFLTFLACFSKKLARSQFFSYSNYFVFSLVIFSYNGRGKNIYNLSISLTIERVIH